MQVRKMEDVAMVGRESPSCFASKRTDCHRHCEEKQVIPREKHKRKYTPCFAGCREDSFSMKGFERTDRWLGHNKYKLDRDNKH